MNYFYACHWEQKGDLKQQRQYLDNALAADPAEIDTLIACYKLPDAGPEYRQKILERIAKAAAEMRAEIKAAPDDPSGYNQLAWLVGNTEGDFAEALKLGAQSGRVGARQRRLLRHPGPRLLWQGRSGQRGEISDHGRRTGAAFAADRQGVEGVSRQARRGEGARRVRGRG